MLELEGDFATPLNAPARDRFLPGGAVSVAALFAPIAFLLPSLRLRALLLGDGPAPPDPGVADPGVGTLYSLTAGFRLRTDGLGQPAPEPEATGFWIEIDLGAALTGLLVRPCFEVALGYLWDVGATSDVGHIDIGPVARFVHVLQTDERGIDPNSTYMLLLGIDVVLFDAEPAVVQERAISTRDAPHSHGIEGADSDGDGIDDSDDACPRAAEDLDGVRDLDGCPDPDDDGDGILDVDDECPRDAEDVDGFEDTDGCPDRDNDGDSYGDEVDGCPNDAETENGYQDSDGCPDLDPSAPPVTGATP